MQQSFFVSSLLSPVSERRRNFTQPIILDANVTIVESAMLLLPPVFWDGWEAYYQIMHYEGDRSVNVK